MAMHVLENEFLKVVVADAGAELSSVVDKESGLERLHDANPEVWNRHAPILFPFVGKVVGGTYRIGDKEYEMKTQHGFARDMEFEFVEADDSIHPDLHREVFPIHFPYLLRYLILPPHLLPQLSKNHFPIHALPFVFSLSFSLYTLLVSFFAFSYNNITYKKLIMHLICVFTLYFLIHFM